MIFPCKYPILCLPMNVVSDARLAIAAHNAGIFPGLVMIDADECNRELITFREQTGCSNIMVAIDLPNILKSHYIDVLIRNKVSHIELLDSNISQEHRAVLNSLRNNGVKVIAKWAGVFMNPSLRIESKRVFDAITIKGPNAAGRVEGKPTTLMQKILAIKALYPNVDIIATGGISTKQEIKELLDIGAVAVGMGTIFAVSEESKISRKTKLQMISSGFNSVTTVGESRQNALVFTDEPDYDMNNTNGLEHGITSPERGLVFMGRGIQNVHSIKPVSVIVEELTKEN